MELQFDKSMCRYLRRVVSHTQTQEQTQELRLPDALPDIGRVIGCWGQPTVRSKEWRSNTMNVSGGVMTWVLYIPEDGSEPRCMDCWIPFQMKWDLPQTQRDGTICVVPKLRSVDARCTSPRKMMIRTCVSVFGEALEPVQEEISVPVQVPEDVQLLINTYPVTLPREAGEKAFVLEDELIFPDAIPAIRKVVYYETTPMIAEQKVLAGKLIFRGSVGVHMLYLTDDGALCTWDCEVPFSQYTDLDLEHSSNADAGIDLLLTSADLEQTPEGKLFLKCALASQYMVCDRLDMQIVEDAYSTGRNVTLSLQTCKMPVRLDEHRDTVSCQCEGAFDAARVVDTCWYHGHGECMQQDQMLNIEVPGQCQILYYDAEGMLQSALVPTQTQMQILSAPENRVDIRSVCKGRPLIEPQMGAVAVSADLDMNICAYSDNGITMVDALTLGDVKQPNPNRASVILRRTGDSRLWDIAKEYGSTVDAIRSANRLTDEPVKDSILLIPVS